MGTDELLVRLAAVEDRMRLLQNEVDSIRLALQEQAPDTSVEAEVLPTRPRAPFPRAQPRQPFPPAQPRQPFPTAQPRQPFVPAAPRAARPERPRRELDLAELFGARALAWAGGVVMLLGVVFFFVLAAGRGWIGPGARVACGATASTLVFAAGLWLRRRFGETYSSLAAVGAGIAGGYATLPLRPCSTTSSRNRSHSASQPESP